MNEHALALFVCALCVVSVAPVHGQGGAWEGTEMADSSLYVGTLFVATDGVVFAGTNNGLFRSSDEGDSWAEVGPVGVNNVVQMSSLTLVAVGHEGVHRSIDGGLRWTEVLPKPVSGDCLGDLLQFTFVLKLREDELITGAIEEGLGSSQCKIEPSLYRSFDAGKSWERNGRMYEILAATVAPSGRILLGGVGGSIGTVDVHPVPAPWTSYMFLADFHPASITDVASLPSGIMYAATGAFPYFLGEQTGRGIYRSADNGETWHQINEGLTDTTVTDLAVYENGTLLASTPYGGVHRSTDGGDTWHPINSGLSSLWVTALAITEDGYVYAGTARGIFRSTSAIATSAQEEAGLPEGFVLEQNYPNPFNPGTTISYALPQSGHVRLTIYDAMGREVKRLVDGVQPGGSHTAAFDAHGLPSGVYVYRLQAGAYIEERRMVLVR